MTNDISVVYEELDPIKKAAIIGFLNEAVSGSFNQGGAHTTSTIQIFLPQEITSSDDVIKCVVDRYNTEYDKAVRTSGGCSHTSKVMVYPYITYHHPDKLITDHGDRYIIIHTVLFNVDDVQLYPLGKVK